MVQAAKNPSIGLLVLLGLFIVGSGVVMGQGFTPGQVMIDIYHEYLPISITVDSAGNIQTGLLSVDSLNAFHGCLSFKKISNYDWEPVRGMYVLAFPETVSVFQLVSSYLQDVHVHLADPCHIRTPFGHIPTDSLYPEQWGHDGDHMKTESAWRYTSGSPLVVIQVIDWGTDWGHPDLAGNVWQNLGEDADGDGHTIEWDPGEKEWIFDPGDVNLWDDDTNIFPDDFVGWDFYEWTPFYLGDNNPGCEQLSGYHGDHIAGTIAAVTNNTLTDDEASNVCGNMRGTVAGTSWFSKIMITRFSGAEPQAVQAIEYGVANGAHIINMSWGGTEPNTQLEQALVGAYNEGLLLVAAAGNYIYDVPAYPAAYPCVMAVAATDPNDVKESYSNYGTWVDLCAPGDNWSPGREFGHFSRYCYSEMGGTSIAAPFVAGVAALVWSCNRDASNSEVRDALESTADYICNLPGNQGQPWCYPFNKLGHGRVNALEAVKVFRPVPPPPGDCNHDMRVGAGDVVYLISYIYRNGPRPDPVCVGDVTDDGVIDAEDVTYLLNYLFHNGPPPQDGCD